MFILLSVNCKQANKLTLESNSIFFEFGEIYQFHKVPRNYTFCFGFEQNTKTFIIGLTSLNSLFSYKFGYSKSLLFVFAMNKTQTTFLIGLTSSEFDSQFLPPFLFFFFQILLVSLNFTKFHSVIRFTTKLLIITTKNL